MAIIFSSNDSPTVSILRDVTEEPVFDLVPLRGARRVVAYRDAQPGGVGQRLEFALPQSHTGAMGAAAIGGDQQPGCGGITLPPHLLKPAADGVDGELGGVPPEGRCHGPLVMPTLTQP